MRGRNPKLQEIQELLQFRGNKSIQLYCIKRLLIGLLLSFSPFWMVSNGRCSGTKGSRTEVWPSSRRALTRREPRRERGWSTTSAGQNFSLLLWVFSCNLLIICGSEFFSSLDNPNLGRYMKNHMKTPFVGRHSRKFPNGLEASNLNNSGIFYHHDIINIINVADQFGIFDIYHHGTNWLTDQFGMFTNACGEAGWSWSGRTHSERVCCRFFPIFYLLFVACFFIFFTFYSLLQWELIGFIILHPADENGLKSHIDVGGWNVSWVFKCYW